MEHLRTEQELRRALQKEPKLPSYLTQLAALLGRENRITEALNTIEQAVQQPDCPSIAHQIHGDLLRTAGHPGEAAGAYSLAVRADPSRPDPIFRMGLALEEAGVPDGAKQAFEQTLIREPEHTGAFLGIARLLARSKHHTDAVKWIQNSPKILENSAELQILLASELLAEGNFKESIRLLSTNRELLNHNPEAASLLIRAMTYSPQVDAKTLYEASTEWAEIHCLKTSETVSSLHNPNPNRCLRIGFVSSRLNCHNSSVHLKNLISHADHNQFEIVLFSDTHQLDSFSSDLRNLADGWHDISKQSALEAAETVRKQKIDILVDLHEHSNDSRLQIFGLKPAPLQVHWYANAVTTGLSMIDYRISTAIADPEDEDCYSAEKVIRLPNYYCYSPSPEAEKTEWMQSAPAEKNGFITFGAIHNLAKYNDKVLDVWSSILKQIPTARLLLGRNDFFSEKAKSTFLHQLKKRKLPLNRIELESSQTAIESLRIFNRIDIVLDSWPYNGVASTADGLWMGVPTITLYGNRTAGRRAADQLTLCGHPEWIARNETEYIEKAVALASNIKLLKAARAALHDEFARCPMCNHAETARNIFGSFRTIWKTACFG